MTRDLNKMVIVFGLLCAVFGMSVCKVATKLDELIDVNIDVRWNG